MRRNIVYADLITLNINFRILFIKLNRKRYNRQQPCASSCSFLVLINVPNFGNVFYSQSAFTSLVYDSAQHLSHNTVLAVFASSETVCLC